MCKAGTTMDAEPQRAIGLVFSLKACSVVNGRPPHFLSVLLTVSVIVALLFGIERLCQIALEEYKDSHELLAIETNRLILARHMGVDALSCFVCAGLGYKARHLVAPVFAAMSKPLPPAAYDSRILTFQPESFRLSVFFFAYQVKNLCDTIVWNDGPEFIFHHVFSMITAWGSIFSGLCHMYAIFYFGVSEVSTAVLCILSNFDDDHGVPGLGDAFPIPKVAVGGVFITLFITIRCIAWPFASYYFIRDVRMTLEKQPGSPSRTRWLRFYIVSLGGLSVLQVAWLGQIFVIAQEELTKIGLL